MDLEIGALLFQRPTDMRRKNFKSTLFVENSMKLNREVRVYSLLAHRVWIELEADPHVVEYNEDPQAIAIPMGDKIIKQRFNFAARRDDGSSQVILVRDEDQGIDGSIAEGDTESSVLLATEVWAKSQQVQFQYVTRASLEGTGRKSANLRQMLKFVETARNCRHPDSELSMELVIQKLAPVQVRRVIENLSGFEETLVIALIARNLLSGKYTAPIDRRDFDGTLVLDLMESEEDVIART